MDLANNISNTIVELVKSKTLTYYDNINCQIFLANLISLRIILLGFFETVGRDLEPIAGRNKWSDAKSVFEKLFRTGIITNIGHINPTSFFGRREISF